MSHSPEQQLVLTYLADAHSIELQALDQMRAAPKLAADDGLARSFELHLHETLEHERRVRQRLEELGGSPSKTKDLAGRLGAVGMVLFARLQPDTTGKLAAHAFSYEHMELAAYELLELIAERTGDTVTAQLAREIGAQEAAMATRVGEGFDGAVDASLKGVDDLDSALNSYLADAHALEAQATQLLGAAPALAGVPALAEAFEGHLLESRAHKDVIEGLLRQRDSSPSRLKDAALRIGALNMAGFLGSQPDTPIKLAGFAFAFEHIEIAGYRLLRRVAERAGATDVARTAREIELQEQGMADFVRGCFSAAVDHELHELAAPAG